MLKENNNQSKKEECPLCKVSEDTIERLKKEKEENLQKENPSKKKVLILVLIIFIIGLAGIAFYKISPNFSLDQEQSEEKKGGGIFDILSKSIEVGNFAPDFVSEDVYGNKISLSEFRGKKPVFLIFWATWCGVCAAELPDLKDFTKKYQNEIQVFAISSGEGKETIKNYIQEEGVNFLMLMDENRKIWNQYLVRGTPSHFLIDKEGKIVGLRPGLASKENLEIMLTMLKEL